MSTKLITDYTEVSAAADSDYLFLHDGSGLKKIQKQNFMSKVEILAALMNGTYTGRDLTVVFADEIANYSDEWAWIQARLDAGDLSGLYQHDYIPITAKGENHEAQIAGINTYKGTGSTEVKDHIDWITRDCLSDTVQWNTTNNNNGNATYANPFMASNLYTWLTGTVYPTLDDKLKAVIKGKDILAPTRYTSGSTLTDDNSWGWVTFSTLWVPFEGEVFEYPVFSTMPWGNGQAVQYPIFANSYNARMKGAGPGGSRCSWWEASAHSGDSTTACYVYYSGYANSYYASDAYRVPVCFRTMAA